ncbi:phosphatase PAP2 family protein [Rhodoferax ferrireducens]|uniref:phosphatase PAP2 family protein n=1 Tax=Rhodoferax ferrireducens TaxID=192843 RepID=UPI00031CFBA3|nr:phosphatase PAP2 family protein [Rhodoferax ferrireducens]
MIKTAGRLGFAWTLTWIVISIDVLWLLLAGWSVSGRGIAVLTLAIMVFRAPLAIGRYRSDLRIRVTARAAVLLIVFMASAATLSYLVTSTNAPLVDAPLAAWDRALGFDWLALHGWLQSHPPAQTTLHIAYQSGLIQLAFVILFLGFSARPAQLDEFMRLFIVATVLTILMSGPFPAAGAWKHHALAGPFDLSSLSHFELLRDGRMRDIPLRDMQGLISIPSLHTVMAVLLVYAMRGTGILLSVFIVVNVAMLVSIPVDGGHYLVDVIAGAAMAFGLIALERRQSTRPHAVANTTLPTTLKEVNR